MVDTADGVVTNGGVAFRVVGVDDAEIFYYDEELGHREAINSMEVKSCTRVWGS